MQGVVPTQLHMREHAITARTGHSMSPHLPHRTPNRLTPTLALDTFYTPTFRKLLVVLDNIILYVYNASTVGIR
jgi:hypothetical protein